MLGHLPDPISCHVYTHVCHTSFTTATAIPDDIDTGMLWYCKYMYMYIYVYLQHGTCTFMYIVPTLLQPQSTFTGLYMQSGCLLLLDILDASVYRAQSTLSLYCSLSPSSAAVGCLFVLISSSNTSLLETFSVLRSDAGQQCVESILTDPL